MMGMSEHLIHRRASLTVVGDMNAFISPLSIEMALTMTCNGAAGATQQAMAGVLHSEGLSLQQANGANAGLHRSLLAPDSGVSLSIANSLWALRGVMFLINAIYFEAKWQKPFAKTDTQDRPFFYAIQDGQTGVVLFMGVLRQP